MTPKTALESSENAGGVEAPQQGDNGSKAGRVARGLERIDEGLKAEIASHAGRVQPNEACGFIIETEAGLLVWACVNCAGEPTKDFLIPAAEYRRAAEAGEIVCLWHSHVNKRPEASLPDKVISEQQDLPLLIVSWPSCEWGWYEAHGFVAPYEGRPFCYGVTDCLALIEDWYKREFGITWEHIEHEYDWWHKGQDLYRENYRKGGFVEITGELKYGDLLLMQIDSEVPNHAAIYVGDGMILHHLQNRLSERAPYSETMGYFGMRTTAKLRHESQL